MRRGTTFVCNFTSPFAMELALGREGGHLISIIDRISEHFAIFSFAKIALLVKLQFSESVA